MARPKIGYENFFTTGTVTVTDEAAGYEKEHAYNWNTYDFWKAAGGGVKYITVDLGAADIADYAAIAAHTLGTNGGTVQCQSSTNGSSWTNRGSAVSPSTNSPIFITFTAVSARYWRLQLTSTPASVIGVASIGQAFELTRAASSGFVLPREARQNKIINNVSEGGAFLGKSIIAQGFSANYTFGIQTLAFVRGDWSTFIDHAVTKPFFFSWNPDYDDGVYAWIEGDPTPPSYDRVNTLSVGMNLRGLR
jgi:hypothetical protein